MPQIIEPAEADAVDVRRELLEQTLVEAFYLGHSLRGLAAQSDFAFRQVTASVCEPLLAWAKFLEERLAAGERPFGPPPSPRPTGGAE